MSSQSPVEGQPDMDHSYVSRLMEAINVNAMAKISSSMKNDPRKIAQKNLTQMFLSIPKMQITGSCEFGLDMLSKDQDFWYSGSVMEFIRAINSLLKKNTFTMSFSMANLAHVKMVGPFYGCPDHSFDFVLTNVDSYNLNENKENCKAFLQISLVDTLGVQHVHEYLQPLPMGVEKPLLPFCIYKSQFLKNMYQELSEYPDGPQVLLILRTFSCKAMDQVPTFALVIMALMVLRSDRSDKEPSVSLRRQYVMEAILGIIDFCIPTRNDGVFADPDHPRFRVIRSEVFDKFISDFKLDNYSVSTPASLWDYLMTRPQLKRFHTHAWRMHLYVFSMINHEHEMKQVRQLSLFEDSKDLEGAWLLNTNNGVPMLPRGIFWYLSCFCVMAHTQEFWLVEKWYYTVFRCMTPFGEDSARKEAIHAFAMAYVQFWHFGLNDHVEVLAFFQLPLLYKQFYGCRFGDFNGGPVPACYDIKHTVSKFLVDMDTHDRSLSDDMRMISRIGGDVQDMGKEGVHPVLLMSINPSLTAKDVNDIRTAKTAEESARLLSSSLVHVFFVPRPDHNHLEMMGVTYANKLNIQQYNLVQKYNLLTAIPILMEINVKRKNPDSVSSAKRGRSIFKYLVNAAQFKFMGSKLKQLPHNTLFVMSRGLKFPLYVVDCFVVSFMDKELIDNPSKCHIPGLFNNTRPLDFMLKEFKMDLDTIRNASRANFRKTHDHPCSEDPALSYEDGAQ